MSPADCRKLILLRSAKRTDEFPRIVLSPVLVLKSCHSCLDDRQSSSPDRLDGINRFLGPSPIGAGNLLVADELCLMSNMLLFKVCYSHQKGILTDTSWLK